MKNPFQDNININPVNVLTHSLPEGAGSAACRGSSSEFPGAEQRHCAGHCPWSLWDVWTWRCSSCPSLHTHSSSSWLQLWLSHWGRGCRTFALLISACKPWCFTNWAQNFGKLQLPSLVLLFFLKNWFSNTARKMLSDGWNPESVSPTNRLMRSFLASWRQEITPFYIYLLLVFIYSFLHPHLKHKRVCLYTWLGSTELFYFWIHLEMHIFS